MNTLTPAVLEHVATDLVRRGLPVDYALRAAAELGDHYRDLVAEMCAEGFDEAAASVEALRRLGNARSIMRKTVREYQSRFWCGRWPLLTYLLGPILILAVVWVAIGLTAFCIFWPLEQMGFSVNPITDGVVSPLEYLVNRFIQALFLFIAPAIALVVLSRLAKKAAMGSSWVCLSASILAVLAGMFLLDFAYAVRADMPADQPLVVIGLPMLDSWKWYTRNPVLVAQSLLPLGIATGLLLRRRQLALRCERLLLADC